MGYQSGTATGPTDLLSKLRTFLLAEGWTEDDYSADGTGYRLHMHKVAQSGGPTMHFNFRSAADESGSTITGDNSTILQHGIMTGLVMNGSTGYDAGEAWHEQPGFPISQDYGSGLSCGMVMSPMSISAIPAYYFFSVGDTINIAVEVTSGKFQFMSFGCLEKQGAYTGGQFFSGSFASHEPHYDYEIDNYAPHYFSALRAGNSHGCVYLDVDGTADWRISKGSSTAEILFPCVSGQRGNPLYSLSGLASMFWSFGPNFYNSIAAMCPIYVLGKRSDNNYSLLGCPAGVRFLNCTNYSAGQEVTYGTETWKIFHADSLDQVPDNMYCGFAFLKEL